MPTSLMVPALLLVLMLTAPLWGWPITRKHNRARASTVSGNTRQTGPAWVQDTPWVLDLEDEEEI